MNYLQPSILHLLLCNFFGYSVQDLSTAEIELYPLPLSKISSWPCLNHLCECFQKDFIKANITYTAGKKKRRIQSVKVACPKCGYTYSKVILFGENDDPHRVGSVTKYGWLWDRTLKELWEKPDLSLTDIRLHLRVGHKNLTDQAIRLNLNPYRTYGMVIRMIKKHSLNTNQFSRAYLDTSYDMTDNQWTEIKPLLSQNSPRPHRKFEQHRGWINGIIWKYHYGLSWSHIPVRYGSVRSIVRQYRKWRRSGFINKIFAILGLGFSNWNTEI